MRPVSLFVASLLVLGSLGCHSAYIEATVSNHTSQAIQLIEVDYPNASFGTQLLAPGADFHYRFKVQGGGASKLLWTDAAHSDHTLAGPSLQEDDEGKLTVTFLPDGPVWGKTLTNHGKPRD